MSKPFAVPVDHQTNHRPAANTAAVASVPLRARNVVQGVMCHWSYDATPTGGKVTIKSGTTVISEVEVTASGPGFLPLNGYNSTIGEALSATLAAGGSGVSGKVSISGRYKR